MSRNSLKLAVLFAILALALSSVTALAADTTTEVTKDLHDVVPITDSCQGNAPGVAVLDVHGVFHLTQLDNGTFHATFSMIGTVALVLDDPTLPTTTGRFTLIKHFEANQHGTNGQQIQTITGKIGDDPSPQRVFHETFHINVDANGEVTLLVDHFTIQCP